MAKQKHIETIVDELPDCDICKEEDKQTKASYDGKTKHLVWAYMCEDCFQEYGAGLGLGRGQKLIVRYNGENTK